jgi:polyhydroxyalkanoate synthesis regulator phasin
MLAACGQSGPAEPVFEPQRDVASAGVLLALPGLLVNGLLKYCDENFRLSKGYYALESLMMILAFVVLLRIKSLEKVRYCDTGELGRLVGLDRIPEVKTLRRKIEHLSKSGDPQRWEKQLATYWMEQDPDLAGTLYVDGHVRVYHGSQTQLPKRYVSREKLCLRGITDWWVNDGTGQPFFVVSEVINAGMLAVLQDKIMPRLLQDVPHQPGQEQLDAHPYLYRFGIVFDREGYSPAFMKQLWQQRIACYTYRKYVSDKWPESEFTHQKVVMPGGEGLNMNLAERGIYYEKEKFWVREIRKLTDSGHQTALITTDYYTGMAQAGGRMFARWSQENFFKYMMEHYGIDRLIQYGVEKMDETVKLVNPVYRHLDSQVRSSRATLSRKTRIYGELILEAEINEQAVARYAEKKSALREEIEALTKDLEVLKEERKQTAKHVLYADLPEAEQFKKLKSSGKQFVDTIKMIAYRAETAMAQIVKGFMLKKDEARAFIRQICMTDADMQPDHQAGILHIRLHTMTNPRNNVYAEKLCQVLNDSETVFPGTNLRLVYSLVSNQFPAGQEV